MSHLTVGMLYWQQTASGSQGASFFSRSKFGFSEEAGSGVDRVLRSMLRGIPDSFSDVMEFLGMEVIQLRKKENILFRTDQFWDW